ncbi:MAG: c-type cytochrome, partial [Acidobacteriota bacterium]
MTLLRVLVVLSSLVVATAAAPPPETPRDTLVRAGRDLYRGAGPRNVTARLEGTELLVSHRQMRCAQCHGADGAGGTEGGVVVPTLQWPAPGVGADGSGEASAVARYDEARFMRAVAQGVGSEGRPLSSVMPRFDVTPREAASLFAYLRALADDRPVDPGIATDRLRLGAVLPLSGSLAAQGEAVAATLRAFADTVN